MIKLFGIGRHQNSSNSNSTTSPPVAPSTAIIKKPFLIRIQKEFDDLDLFNQVTLEFPNPNDLSQFLVCMKPDEGYWQGASCQFSFVIPDAYPFAPPKVQCLTKLFHPNIDFSGHICLNILREDWRPVLCISTVIDGIYHLLLQPNPEDGLNQSVARLMRESPQQFEEMVYQTLRGASWEGENFEALL